MTKDIPKKAKELKNAAKTKKAVILRLSKDDMVGNDIMLLTQAQNNSIQKAMIQNKGVTLKLSGKQIKTNLTVEGGFLPALLAFLPETALPALTSKILPALGRSLDRRCISFSFEYH